MDSTGVAIKLYDFLVPDRTAMDGAGEEDMMQRLEVLVDEWVVDDLDVTLLFTELANYRYGGAKNPSWED